tara:strand:+ start:2553 stop:3158 length:606 start_codon:yes stop_codon:yes gene_type:complete
MHQLMSISQILQDAISWLAWSGLGLFILTIIFFIFNWGGKFRLVGATIFTLLLSASCWAFSESYRPPFKVEGAEYAPVVYDNGYDLVVAQAPKEFPSEAIQPTLEQIAGNLKGGGRNRSLVHVRIRKLETVENGISKPIILGEVLRDVVTNQTLPLPQSIQLKDSELVDETTNSDEIDLGISLSINETSNSDQIELKEIDQ